MPCLQNNARDTIILYRVILYEAKFFFTNCIQTNRIKKCGVIQ